MYMKDTQQCGLDQCVLIPHPCSYRVLYPVTGCCHESSLNTGVSHILLCCSHVAFLIIFIGVGGDEAGTFDVGI